MTTSFSHSFSNCWSLLGSWVKIKLNQITIYTFPPVSLKWQCEISVFKPVFFCLSQQQSNVDFDCSSLKGRNCWVQCQSNLHYLLRCCHLTSIFFSSHSLHGDTMPPIQSGKILLPHGDFMKQSSPFPVSGKYLKMETILCESLLPYHARCPHFHSSSALHFYKLARHELWWFVLALLFCYPFTLVPIMFVSNFLFVFFSLHAFH